MPERPTPILLLDEISQEFDLPEVTSVEPWPFLPQDRRAMTRLVARFESQKHPLVLKARTSEHRRAGSLSETQRLQMELAARGVATPALMSMKSGGYLTHACDPRDTSDPHHDCFGYILGPGYYDVPAIHFEIQEIVEGAPPSGDADWARIGEACGLLHRAGHQPEARSYDPSEDAPDIIDTFLPNKFFYTPAFLSRRNQQVAQLREAKLGGQWDDRKLEIVQRRSDLLWRRDLTWSVLHGDLNCDNLILSDGRVVFIDFDEAGLGEVCFDLAQMTKDLESRGEHATEDFFRGYISSGAPLGTPDLQALVDDLALSWILEAGDDTEAAVEALKRSDDLLDMLCRLN